MGEEGQKTTAKDGFFSRTFDQTLNDFTVANMNAIKSANGKGDKPQRLTIILNCRNDLHKKRLSLKL